MLDKCDICGKENTWIEPLKSDYATEDIKGVCSTCLAEANRHLDKLCSMISQLNKTWMKRFMESMKLKRRK